MANAYTSVAVWWETYDRLKQLQEELRANGIRVPLLRLIDALSRTTTSDNTSLRKELKQYDR